jgi:hypothetical protein
MDITAAVAAYAAEHSVPSLDALQRPGAPKKSVTLTWTPRDPVPPHLRVYRDAYRDGTTIPHVITWEGHEEQVTLDVRVTAFTHTYDEDGCDVYQVTCVPVNGEGVGHGLAS